MFIKYLLNNYQFGNFFVYLSQNFIDNESCCKKDNREFWVKHNDTEEPLKTWYKEASKATWNDPSDIKAEYVKASILKNSRVVFNICGNKYRLIVEINYKRKWVFIRFIGTHKDYNNIDANKIQKLWI